MTDPIADFLTRIRNAVKANHKVVEAPGSKIKQEITKILYEQGYILAYKFDTDEKGHPSIKIALKWDAATKGNAIKDLKRVSRPGLRQYVSVADMPRVLNGLGIVLSPEDNPGYLPGLNSGAFNLGAGLSYAVLYAAQNAFTASGGATSGYLAAMVGGVVLLGLAFCASLLIPKPGEQK